MNYYLFMPQFIEWKKKQKEKNKEKKQRKKLQSKPWAAKGILTSINAKNKRKENIAEPRNKMK